MDQLAGRLQDLYNSIPRRHNAENIALINGIVDDYAGILGEIELASAWYEQQTARFYPSLDTVQNTLKMSNSNKHSKKAKDDLFDEASGILKDDIQALIKIHISGKEQP
jgi:hypothetical protein